MAGSDRGVRIRPRRRSQAGGGAFAALLHYIAIVSSVGLVVLFAAYLLGSVVGGAGFTRFAKALLPAQAVAVSTQSSLASLPAMLDSANRLDLRERTAEFVLPLAVAIFRATSPAMNLAVVIYVAYLMNVPLGPARYAAAIGVAFIISIGSVSLPGTISFVVSVGPIALRWACRSSHLPSLSLSRCCPTSCVRSPTSP